MHSLCRKISWYPEGYPNVSQSQAVHWTQEYDKEEEGLHEIYSCTAMLNVTK